ncbi:hypothetical protein ACFVS2_20240 [Brevibacillus sp. NPDC058079]|uniref:DUF7275 domain-containing protein n=1 Tax=Brevibacillus sp. NPDC058079 TaxID=3346330 RepID=UPI0036E07402
MIVIGSKALLHQLKQEDDERFTKSDFDVIMSLSDFSMWHKAHLPYIVTMIPSHGNKYRVIVIKDGIRKLYEIELATEGTSSRFLLDHIEEVTSGTVQGVFGENYASLTLSYQMLTKRSHLIYPVHFEKNMEDYQLLKNILGDLNKDEYMETYYNLRYEEAKKRYKQKTPKLNVTTEDFFSSKLAVEPYFVHDDLHELMAHNDRPVYTMMQKDNSKAWCEKEMFYALPYEYQVQAVQEEGYVIALERYIIPQFGDSWEDHFECYKKALKRICTTLTSGWFREFAIENYDEAVRRYNPEFVSIFKDAYMSGRIKPKAKYSSEDIPAIA